MHARRLLLIGLLGAAKSWRPVLPLIRFSSSTRATWPNGPSAWSNRVLQGLSTPPGRSRSHLGGRHQTDLPRWRLRNCHCDRRSCLRDPRTAAPGALGGRFPVPLPSQITPSQSKGKPSHGQAIRREIPSTPARASATAHQGLHQPATVQGADQTAAQMGGSRVQRAALEPHAGRRTLRGDGGAHGAGRGNSFRPSRNQRRDDGNGSVCLAPTQFRRGMATRARNRRRCRVRPARDRARRAAPRSRPS